jgi:hypothetical protein
VAAPLHGSPSQDLTWLVGGQCGLAWQVPADADAKYQLNIGLPEQKACLVKCVRHASARHNSALPLPRPRSCVTYPQSPHGRCPVGRYNEFGDEIWAKTFMSKLAQPSQATAIALMDTDLWVAGTTLCTVVGFSQHRPPHVQRGRVAGQFRTEITIVDPPGPLDTLLASGLEESWIVKMMD